MNSERIARLVSACDMQTERILKQAQRKDFPDIFPLPVSFCGRRLAAHLSTLTGSFLSPASRHFRSPVLIDAMARIATALINACNPDGTLNSGNFASPPDTAFVASPIGAVLRTLKRCEPERAADLIERIAHLLKRIGEPLVTGGIHTPNHRWVVCAALAYLHHFFPDPRYLSRIDAWLAEGIDADPDGQFCERSAGIYSLVTVNALIHMAELLDRPALLEPVRRCLAMMVYYMRPDGTVETAGSRRQDQHEDAAAHRWYAPYRYMALRDRNGTFATVAQTFETAGLPDSVPLLMRLLEDPPFADPLPPAVSLPEAYHIFFPHSGIVRIRDLRRDATLFAGSDGPGEPVSGLARNPSFFRLQKGAAHLCALRIAPMYFSSGYVQPINLVRDQDAYRFEQTMAVSYFQPLAPEHQKASGLYDLTDAEGRYWSRMGFPLRQRANVQTLAFALTFTPRPAGFSFAIDIHGPVGVPIAIEFAFPRTGRLEHVVSAQTHPEHADEPDNVAFLTEGTGVYRNGDDTIAFGPGDNAHRWHPFQSPTGFHLPPHEPQSRQYVYIPMLTPISTTITIE